MYINHNVSRKMCGLDRLEKIETVQNLTSSRFHHRSTNLYVYIFFFLNLCTSVALLIILLYKYGPKKQ